jgi:PAS domain S-box-containing protein
VRELVHDLNNMLAIILAYAQLGASHGVDDRTQRELGEIEQAAGQAVGVVRRLFGHTEVDDSDGPQGATALAGVSAEAPPGRRVEIALDELAAIVESSDDAIIGKTLAGTITSWNPGAERMYGVGAAEAIGRSISFLVPSSRPHELEQILDLVRSGKSIKRYETTRIHMDGAVIDVALTISPIRDGTGAIVGASTIARDISPRIRGEEALLRSEENYRELFERHPTPMWVYDLETLTFLAVNHAAIRAYGYTADEFLAMTVEELIPERARAAVREQIHSVGTSRVEANVLTFVRRDRSEVDVSLTSNALEFEGRTARLVLVQDVTEQHSLEGQLRQTHKLEAIGRLAGGIAHDFNNILLVIRVCGELLLKQLGDERLRERVLEIDSAAQRAARLTHQLLAFSSQQVLRPEAVDLNEVVVETLALVERVIGEDIEIACKLAPQLESIVADRGQLGQVVLNLAVNAREAMPEGGRLELSTMMIDFESSSIAEGVAVPDGRYVLLQVADTGMGMTEGMKSRVFDPFFTTKEGGSGLGLATVYGIVKQSGGHISLDSGVGIGTTFKVYFPGGGAAEVPTPPQREINSLEGQETILLVEDDATLRPLIGDALRAYGYTVLEASNGAEALQLAELQRDSIDLLLTDVVMPGLNGRELAEQLLAVDPTLKVLFTSGYPADAVVRRGIAEARVRYVQKPYLPDELVRMVRELLDFDRRD